MDLALVNIKADNDLVELMKMLSLVPKVILPVEEEDEIFNPEEQQQQEEHNNNQSQVQIKVEAKEEKPYVLKKKVQVMKK